MSHCLLFLFFFRFYWYLFHWYFIPHASAMPFTVPLSLWTILLWWHLLLRTHPVSPGRFLFHYAISISPCISALWPACPVGSMLALKSASPCVLFFKSLACYLFWLIGESFFFHFEACHSLV